MRALQEFFMWLFVFSYVVISMGFVPFGLYMIWKESRNRNKFQDDVKSRVTKFKKIDIELLRQIAKARGIKDGAATAVIRDLLADSQEEETDKIYFDICQRMEEIGPYSDLPADVRNSLLRIKQILTVSETEYSDQILEPIITSLSSYVELKLDYSRSKKISMIMHLIGVVSFLFGVFGVYLTMSNTSPTLEEIKGVFERSVASAPALETAGTCLAEAPAKPSSNK